MVIDAFKKKRKRRRRGKGIYSIFSPTPVYKTNSSHGHF